MELKIAAALTSAEEFSHPPVVHQIQSDLERHVRNGPCPLLAICNVCISCTGQIHVHCKHEQMMHFDAEVLLLRNVLKINADTRLAKNAILPTGLSSSVLLEFVSFADTYPSQSWCKWCPIGCLKPTQKKAPKLKIFCASLC